MTASPCPDEFIIAAKQMVQAARPEISSRYRVPVPIVAKADSSPVTDADRGAEAAIRQIIEQTFPDHGIIGEEFGSVRTQADYVWVLDPIDGTKSFITGIPLFATLIALTFKGETILGLADQVVLDETWISGLGLPATLNDTVISTRRCPSLDQAIVFTSGLEYWDAQNRPRLDAAMNATYVTRMGADAYGFLQVAAGFADIAIECGVNAFDVMALIPIVENAGGRVTDFSGNPIALDFDGSILATGDPTLHDSVLEIINNAV